MYIQTEETPNPLTLKFLPGQTVMEDGSISFNSPEAAKASLFAQALLAIEGVDAVFFGADFISVTKLPEYQWQILKPHLLTTIMEHFISGKPVMEGAGKVASSSTANADDDAIVAQIKELIDTRVRPAVAEDGGDIIYHGFEDGVVWLEMHGACAGCPSSTVTLKQGIESMLQHYIPEVQRVEAVE